MSAAPRPRDVSAAPRPISLSGANLVEWCDTTHHSSRNAPLNENGADGTSGTGGTGPAIEIRGNATVEELAAVVAALAEYPAVADSTYERWRRGRLAALRRDAD